MIKQVLTLGLTSALLCACVTPQPVPEPATPASVLERQEKLTALNVFSFSGGLGIWTDEESVSARVRWQQGQDELIVDLSGPLGIGDMRLQENEQGALLKRGSAIVARGPSADEVLQQGLDLSAPIPLNELKQWVVGLPGNAKSLQADTAGKLSSLRYTDAQGTRWHARFLKYTNAEDVQLPSLIIASGGPYSVRLVLKNWQLTADSAAVKENSTDTRLAIPAQ